MAFVFNVPIYEHHLTPNGLLPREMKERASAAWYFTMCAMQALERVPQQVSYEGDTDQTVNLRQIADSVATMYSESLENIMPFMDFVKAEALRCGLPWNGRLDAWLASGGKSYNFVTREPDAVNK